MVRILLGIALLAGGMATAQRATVVRLGVFPNVTHGAGLVAIDQGFFQKQLGKVKLDVRHFSNGTQISEAFMAGTLDFAYTGPVPAINAFLRGVPIQIVSAAANGGVVLVARRDAQIKGISDLDGKTVAVSARGATQDILLRHILNDSGLKVQDQGGSVTLVPLDPSLLTTAFANQRMDAALVQEPWGALLESQGAKIVLNEKQLWKDGNYVTTVFVGNPTFMRNNPEITRQMLKGHLAAIQWIRTSKSKAQESISKMIFQVTKQQPDPKTLSKALSRTQITDQLNLSSLQDYARLNQEAGFARDIPDFGILVDRSWLPKK